MTAAEYIAVGLLGVLLGWLGAVFVLRRQDDVVSRPKLGHDPLARAVLAQTRTAYAILDSQQQVVLANHRASQLGVVRAGFADPRIVEAAERALISGEPIDVDLSVSDRRTHNSPTVVHAEVREISEGTVLVVGADESAAARVEAVRRDFVANVSHELKTPIAAISLLAEAVLESADDAHAVRHFTRKITTESTRLNTLISELISLSRLQGGGDPGERPMVSIDAVIDEVRSRTATIAEAAGITVGLGGSRGLEVRGERSLLITALTNLVENAIHYSPNGTPVTINRVLRGTTVQVAVTDRGRGIPADQQERVFERFYRADPARSRQTGGTGLGLAIVKHIAANHGGSVSLWSRVGTGSTFTLHLPAVPSTDGGGGAVSSPATPGSPSGDIPGAVQTDATTHPTAGHAAVGHAAAGHPTAGHPTAGHPTAGRT